MTARIAYIAAAVAAAVVVTFIPSSFPLIGRWALIAAALGVLLLRDWHSDRS